VVATSNRAEFSLKSLSFFCGTSSVYEITKDVNIKIWIAIKFLSTYVSIRPGEMLNVRERDINLSEGFIVIPHPKEKKPKAASLLDEDIEILKQFPKGLPGLFFFRHPAGLSGARAGERFGNRYLYKYWKRACANLGIEGIDLYGGTRHSTVTALSEHLTPEQIKAGTLHSTNRAFERTSAHRLQHQSLCMRLHGKCSRSTLFPQRLCVITNFP
jgi:integrase